MQNRKPKTTVHTPSERAESILKQLDPQMQYKLTDSHFFSRLPAYLRARSPSPPPPPLTHELITSKRAIDDSPPIRGLTDRYVTRDQGIDPNDKNQNFHIRQGFQKKSLYRL